MNAGHLAFAIGNSRNEFTHGIELFGKKNWGLGIGVEREGRDL